MAEWTRDTPASGVVIYQPKHGFRYAADAFWLAGVALDGPRGSTAIDLGTGSGLVAFLLARTGLRVTGIDARPEWQAAWRLSQSESDVAVDLRLAEVTSFEADRVDLVVCNPPYFKASTGPASTDPWKAAARTETTAILQDFVHAASRLLKPSGRAVFVVPRAREEEIGAPLFPRRVHRIGAQRSVIELSATPGPCERIAYPDRGDEAARLYSIARE